MAADLCFLDKHCGSIFRSFSLSTFIGLITASSHMSPTSMVPWSHLSYMYGGLPHLNNRRCYCVHCKKRHASPRWWGREQERRTGTVLSAFLWCSTCHITLWRSSCRSTTMS